MNGVFEIKKKNHSMKRFTFVFHNSCNENEAFRVLSLQIDILHYFAWRIYKYLRFFFCNERFIELVVCFNTIEVFTDLTECHNSGVFMVTTFEPRNTVIRV